MNHLRAILKIIFTFLYTGFICAVYLILLIPVAITKSSYEPLRNFFMTTWSRGMLWIFNVHIKLKGKIPEPPFFLVSNHLSYLDVIVYYSILKTTFIAKMDVKSWPVLGYLIQSMGVIFIDRKKRSDVRRVNELISSNLNKYQGIILFPEGTTSPGETVLPFRASLLEYPAADNLPVHFSAIRYQTGKNDPPAYKYVSWWGDMEFFHHLYQMATLKQINAKVVFGSETIHESDRKLLAASVFRLIIKSFEPMASPGEVEEYVPPLF